MYVALFRRAFKATYFAELSNKQTTFRTIPNRLTGPKPFEAEYTSAIFNEYAKIVTNSTSSVMLSFTLNRVMDNWIELEYGFLPNPTTEYLLTAFVVNQFKSFDNIYKNISLFLSLENETKHYQSNELQVS